MDDLVSRARTHCQATNWGNFTRKWQKKKKEMSRAHEEAVKETISNKGQSKLKTNNTSHIIITEGY